MSDASQADVVNQAITDDAVPMMSEQNPTEVDLLRGIKEDTDDGVVWHTKAVVRELNGEDEEALSAYSRKDVMYTEYMNALLSRAVVSIGKLNDISDGVINKLVMPDREMLYLAILRVTYGDTRELHTSCQACHTLNTITIDLNEDFPITEPTFDIQVGFKVTVGKTEYTLRLPNGDDTMYAQKHGDTDAKYNTAILSRCVVFNGNQPENMLEWARKLTLPTRKKLIAALLDIDTGPTLEGVDTHCAECGVLMPILLDWVSLLLG